ALAEVTPPPGAPDDFPADADLEFQVSAMQLGYDEDNSLFLVRAAALELIEREGEIVVRDDAEPIFSALLSRAQSQRLSQHLFAIIASGRPRCPFCGKVMEQPHTCDKQNGYHPAVLN